MRGDAPTGSRMMLRGTPALLRAGKASWVCWLETLVTLSLGSQVHGDRGIRGIGF